MADPSLLPEDWRADVDAAHSETEMARLVLDYVAGMTDRFAIQEHARLHLGG
jgi:dGTPase